MGCRINPASLVVRRSCYEAAGPFNEQRLWGIDWDMWLKVAAISGVAYSPRASSRYRIHGASGSSTGLFGPRYLNEDFEVLSAALERLDQDPGLASLRPLRRQALRSYSLRALHAAGVSCEAGQRKGTLRAIGEALRCTPTLATRPTVWALTAGALVGPWCYRAWSRLHPQRPAS